MAAINGNSKDIKVTMVESTFTDYDVKIKNHHS
jgi:hypothetical protein